MTDQETNTMKIRVSAQGMRATDMNVDVGTSLLSVYSKIAQGTQSAMHDVRIVHNSEVVDLDEADNVELQPGDNVDFVSETENG